MRKIFLSFRYTGESHEEMSEVIGNAAESLRYAGHDVFSSLEHEDYFIRSGFDRQRVMDYCLENMRGRDTFLPIVRSGKKSIGMNDESDEALKMGMSYITAIKSGIWMPRFVENAGSVIEYDEYDELYDRLRRLE
ncbi:MAG: hypothetical protein JW789_00975 [Candidatus Aenigmarchaeota archaeon]|nr:hypothetical protein [Candidatus Aenigmarchaeota archaeon]